ncbi:MAG: hypothetical protein H0X01_04900, partial [Nitrospira sp.]|nr:hypothetical protein [Nitrospira sp.]
TKIAQGYQSELVVANSESAGATDYTGFPVGESANEVTLRDATGRVSVIAKSNIKSRRPLQGSIMPEGLADPMTLDDFASLLAFLQSLKTTSH